MSRLTRIKTSSRPVYFRQWLGAQVNRHDRIGKFAQMLIKDDKCPRGRNCGPYQLLDYLAKNDAGREALRACCQAWIEYFAIIERRLDFDPVAGLHPLSCVED